MSPRIRRVVGLIIAAPTYEGLRLTIPAREALERAGNRVIVGRGVDVADPRSRWPVYDVTLTGKVPDGLVLALIGNGHDQHRGLRTQDEEPYPLEWPAGQGIAWYERGEWVPCPAPRCRRALVWYEAGYVPGYRVCTRGHHVQLSSDGRSARVVREG